MKYKIYMLFLFIEIGCTHQTPIKQAIQQDTTPKVVGIGGIFYQAEKPDSLQSWYETQMGMAMSPYGATFVHRNAIRKDELNYLQWGIFKKNDAYFIPSKKEFMINYRVQNLEGLLRKMKKSGVTILDSVSTYDYGKFAHILDPEGNKIELWEPIDSTLTNLHGKTNP